MKWWIWNRYGWYIILFGSIVSLLCLFFFNSREGTTHMSWSQIISQLFQSTPVPSYSPPSPSFSSHESKGEKECRTFLEYFFHKKFDRIRPPFLTNPITHQCLELDCYNDELKLAVEYNGAQHYQYNSMMHQNSKHSFQNQQYRDYIKKDLCEKQGITLIIVPYTIPVSQIPSFLYQELLRHDYRPL